MFSASRRRQGPNDGGKGPRSRAPTDLPALSICRLEAPEELLKKLRRHADDPALAEFTCPICWEPFWQPVRTVCGHAFCEGCLLKSVLAQLGHDQPDVSCPLCRHPLHVEDVSADEALLTRIRLVLAQKNREIETPPGRSSSGRLCRGSTRSPKLETPGALRPLHCTGQPCTPVELPRAQTSSMPRRPILGWMHVAPSAARPATTGWAGGQPTQPQKDDPALGADPSLGALACERPSLFVRSSFAQSFGPGASLAWPSEVERLPGLSPGLSMPQTIEMSNPWRTDPDFMAASYGGRSARARQTSIPKRPHHVVKSTASSFPAAMRDPRGNDEMAPTCPRTARRNYARHRR